MNLYIDIDNTICITPDNMDNKYAHSKPIQERIAHVNELYDKGYQITYWTARGSASGVNYEELTKKQLADWGCKYHHLKCNKPAYDLYIDDKCCHANDYWKHIPSLHHLKKQTPQKVEKGWGHEIIFVNNDEYCGKILHFKKDAKFSMHYHLLKKETWYVSSGAFLFKYIDTKTANVLEEHLEPGDVITNEKGEPHQLICIEEGDVFEVSTTHHDSDSYRVFKGDSQA